METLRKSDEFVLLRGQFEGSPVLLLAPVADAPAASSLRRLEHEMALATELDPEWAVRPLALSRGDGRVALVLEDPGGEPLTGLLGKPMQVERFLTLAIGITDALRQVHARGLIHKDIEPDNILVDDARRVRLTGFGIASRLPRERQLAQATQFPARTLAYMAPEQTGRMNRAVDSRSDLYALGVTFYQMLTGKLPFTATDALEWVHCHIARRPTPPGEYVSIPAPLGDIVLKLLAKSADERYQTAAGLLFDLRDCLAWWQREERIEPFPLARQDAPDRLLISERLHGREKEVAALYAGFKRMLAEAKPGLMLVSGYSGIGKSAIVNELQQTIISDNALFAAGKFDQYKRNVPYAALAQAFAGLVRQLLVKGETEIDRWREALLAALGRNGGVIANLIPEIELIIGKQPPPPEVPPQDIAHRFRRVFGRFLGVFARTEHPLVLFFDDLQWVDTVTLDLLEYLPTDLAASHLLLIGAYRDNEVDGAHSLRRRLEAIGAAGSTIEEIVLTPLPFEDINRMVADALRCPQRQAEALSRLVFQKAGGNPFFVIQFLTNLEDEELLTFDHGTASWSWDLERIGAQGFTDNVGHLLASKLTRLPAHTREALKQFSGLGDAADATTLAMILDSSEDSVETALRDAIAAGLVVRRDVTYEFLHDRIQEAAYALIPEDERPALHLRIGRALWLHAEQTQAEETIFDIVDQLNRGTGLIIDKRERLRVASLDLRAGRRARQASAYSAALAYLRTGKSLLPENCWTECYELAFALEFTLGECEYATVNFDTAEARLSALSTRAATLRDSADLAALRMTLYQALSRTDRAIEVCLEYLRKVGITWTTTPTKEDVLEEYDRLWRRLGDRPIEDLINLPVMADREQQGTLDVLASALAPALSHRNLFHLLIGRMVNMSLEHGNSDGSCLAFLYVNAYLGEEHGDYRTGYRFGKLAIDLVAKGMDRFAPRVDVGFGTTVVPWTRPAREGLPWVRRSIETALERGDLTFAAYSYYLLLPYRLFLGDPLPEVEREAQSALEFVRKLQFDLMVDSVTVPLVFIRALRGLTANAGSFSGGDVDERSLRQQLERPTFGNALCWYWIRKLQTCFLAEDFTGAVLTEAHASTHLRPLLAVFEEAEFHFYAALARAACHDSVPAEERPEYRQALLFHARRLDKLSEDCPANFASRATLVAAEIARLEGRAPDAQQLYEQAIRMAAEQGFVHVEAVALEAASSFYAARSLDAVALGLLRGARSCYQRWGAIAKIQILDRRHPHLREQAIASSSGATARDALPNLDVMSVVKAAQALSGEIVLDQLVDSLLVIAVEHAGADRGLLILCHDGPPRVAAEARSGREKVEVTARRTEVISDALPASILQYVMRSRESVILGDACADALFTSDDYVRRERPRSVLCKPLIKHAKLVGVLYLENRLTPHAFSAERTAVLDVLCAQAAISLENALLYADLRDRESRISRLVQSNMIGIFFWSVDGTITDANDAFLDLLGYSRADLATGQLDFYQITPLETQQIELRRWAQFKAGGSNSPYEKEYVRKDGSRVPALSGYTFLEGSQDQGVTFVLDLTERRQAEIERTARRVAEAANRAKSEFLSSMSHELRTPLNGILGYAQILERDPRLSESQRHGIDVIRHSGQHLLSLINDILELARIEAGKLDFNIADVRLADALRVVREIIQVKAAEKGLSLLWDSAPDLPATVRVDERRLCQVLLNLLANAVKFTDRGHVHFIARRLPDDGLHFEVHDTGVGISDDQLGKLFQPFEQVGEMHRRSVGTGLGLAISREIVRMMASDIHVESRLGEGSCFWFELRPDVVADVEPAAIGSRRLITGYQGPRKTLLVVDDVDENRKVLVDLLAPLGFAMLEAENGREALNQAAALRPDLIITDYLMPVIDGQEATRQLRQTPAIEDVPVIMLSARASGSDEAECLAAGADAFMVKPIDVEKLLTLIAILLKIEWISVVPTAASPTENDSIAATLIPPAQEMQALYLLAREGNMRKIILWAEQVASQDSRYRGFTDELLRLAGQYQSRAILRLVEAHVESSGTS